MPRVKALDRDRAAHPNNRVYHPYVNDPSFCQRLFEIACLVLILASVPAWLGGVYSIFVTGYGTALGLIGLLSFGTRRHSCLFLVMSIIFFIFVIVVIILNAIDPIGKHLPFNDNTDYGAAFGAGGAINNGNNGNNNNNTTSAKRQTTDGTCQYNNCGFDLYKVGQLSDGQLRLMYGAGAGPVTFSLQNGVMSDNSGRKCYLSAQSQLQCDTIPQTNDYTKFCIDNGRLTYGGSPLWYQCKTGTGNDAANIYAGKLYGHCSSFMNLTCVNSTCGAGSEGIPTDIGSDPFANGGGVLEDGGNNNGTNSTDGNLIGGGGANNSTGFGAGGLYADRRFNGSRVYAYIDSGIILAATLLTIISALAILKEVRPAPGTLTHSSTTTTTSAPAAFGNTGTAGYGVPAAAATGTAVPSAFGAHGASNVGTTGHY